MTEDQAYAAMFLYLEDIWQRTKSPDIASILSDLSLLENGKSADPAAMLDWKAVVARVVAGEGAGRLTLS